MIDKTLTLAYRGCFMAALLLLAIGCWDWIIRLFGWTLSWVPYTPGKVIQGATMLMIFVIALLLRQLRQEVKKRS